MEICCFDSGHSKQGSITTYTGGKEVRQAYMLSPCLFKLYAEYITRNARLDEAQARIKIAGRYINNIRYADDTTLMAESKEELKSQKTKIMASGLITSWQMDGETMETVTYFLGLQKCYRWWLQP